MENKNNNENRDQKKHTSFVKEKSRELSAEVPDGLQKAFSDYEQKSEPPWKIN